MEAREQTAKTAAPDGVAAEEDFPGGTREQVGQDGKTL